ncbi:TraQ conjugal transfer family protein, partial [Parabacteroides merdae]
LDDGTVLLPNDRYPLEKETFRLYYTPLSDEQSGFTVWVEDSDGQAVELEFDFNADNDKEDGYGTE